MNHETPQVDHDQGLTVVATAAVVRDLHWVSASLFEMLVFWASEVEPDRGDIAVWLSTAGRHLGDQAEDLKALMPDSVLLGELACFGAPCAESLDAVQAIRAVPGSVVRLAIAQRVLLARLAASCESLQRLTEPHADAPLRRVVGFLLLDVRNDREAGERLLNESRNLRISQEISEGVMEAERRLIAAGGLLTAEALR